MNTTGELTGNAIVPNKPAVHGQNTTNRNRSGCLPCNKSSRRGDSAGARSTGYGMAAGFARSPWAALRECANRIGSVFLNVTQRPKARTRLTIHQCQGRERTCN